MATKQPTYITALKDGKVVVLEATPATHSQVYFRAIRNKMERCKIDDSNLNQRKVDIIEECEEIIHEIDNDKGQVEIPLIQGAALSIRKNLYYINRFGSWKVNKLPFRSSLRDANKIVDICQEALTESQDTFS